MRFACFGGAAAVADEAVAATTTHRTPRRRWRFFFGSKGEKSPSTGTKRITSPGRRATDYVAYDMIAASAGKSSSVPSSSALSTASSLDSASSSSSSSRSCSRSSSSSSLCLEVVPTPAKKRPDEKRSPAVGVAAVLVCLLMMMFCGRLVATLLTTAVLCFFPRTWPPARARAAESLLLVASSPEHGTASRRQAETIKTKAVMDGFLARNRKK
ncbi:hypothetical protein CFC21_022937 [Triticum aestivum]|uniref:Uncharacterized protein n=2 Tax=Triticum aestivum TaxID=4565 RepID=A0A3B6C6H5_WHEAT|nr:cell wall integrity and stress response component 1-like [Triticum dicoccoides]XP_044319774.1 cell wall integrity and stress response component 1-like [Triticum aestivum]KAF7008078.1 hypothetical protein CFC21_022937 [Triticum aestivum]